MLIKKLTSVVAGVTMAAGTAIAVAPAAAAQVTDAERTVTFECRGDRNGNTVFDTGASRTSTFEVSYPEEVAPGEFFSVTVQPGQMRNNTNQLYRVNFDYALPTNAEIVGMNLSGGQGLSGTAPSVVRVTADNKTTNDNGSVARIWGGNSARWGTSSSTSGTGGLQVGQNTDFRLPQLEIVMRAPATVGETMSIGLPGANLSGWSAASADMQWIRDDPGFFSGNDANECTSNASGAELTTTTVGDLDPVLLDTTTTVSSSLDVLGNTQPTTLTAQVGTQYGALAQMTEGEVTFRDVTADEVLGTATPNANGVATLEHSFDALEPGSPDETRQIVAEFSGVDGDLTGSTSEPTTITLTEGATVFYDTTLTLSALLGEEDETIVPVTVRANINRPSGVSFPEDMLVQLYRGDTPIGEPRPLPAGNQMEWTDSIERLPQTRTQSYRLEASPFVDGYEQYNITSGARVTVTVNGTNPSLDPPIVPGGGSLGALTGSLSFGS